MEEEQAHGALFGMAVDVDFVAQRIAHARRAAVEGQFAAQQAVDALAFHFEIDAQPGDQQQIGLPGFHEDAGRDAVTEHVPGVARDVGLGVDGACPHAALCGVDGDGTVGQKQGRHGHADHATEFVDGGELGPEQVCDGSGGDALQVLSRQPDGLRLGYRDWRCDWCRDWGSDHGLGRG